MAAPRSYFSLGGPDASCLRLAAHGCLALGVWTARCSRNLWAKPLELVERLLTVGTLLRSTGWKETLTTLFLGARCACEDLGEFTSKEKSTVLAETLGPTATVMAQDALLSQVAAALSIHEVWQLRPVSHSWLSLPRARALEEPQSDPAELFAVLDGKASIDRLAELTLRDPEMLKIQDCAGRNALMKAAQLGGRGPVLALLALRAEASARGGNAWTPLHFAAASGHAEVCRLLLASHANAEARSSDGYAPLFYAYRGGADDAAEQLLSAGARPCSKADRWGFTDTGC